MENFSSQKTTAILPKTSFTTTFLEPMFVTSLIILSVSNLLLPPFWFIYSLTLTTLLAGFFLLSNRKNESDTTSHLFTWLLIPLLLLTALAHLYQLGERGFQMDEYYAASEIQTYADSGELFVIGDTPYGRSEITTLTGMTSYLLFTNLSTETVSPEIAFRTPMILFGLMSVLITFFITRHFANTLTALLTSLFIASETYLFYTFSYFRFYAISIFLILLFLFLTWQYKNRYVALTLSLVSTALYALLTEYFLFIAVFFFTLYLFDMIRNRKTVHYVEKVALFTGTILSVTGGYLLYTRHVTSNATYDLVSLTLNADAAVAMFNWILINYAPLCIGALLAILFALKQFFLSPRTFTLRDHLLEYYTLYSLLVLFVYIVNAPFNFTFRVTLFFLPVIFILGFIFFSKILFKKPQYVLLALVLIATNLYTTTHHPIKQPGDTYFPLKPLYEKIDIVTGNKDIAAFFAETIRPTQGQNAVIGYIGLGYNDLMYYLRGDLRPSLTGDFRYRKIGNSTLDELRKFMDQHTDKYIFFVISANALPERKNLLYQTIWNREYVTEVDPALVDYIRKSGNFEQVYTSEDGYSSVYIKV